MTDHWENLRQGYLTKGLTLVLGAGVSCGSKIPSWGQLVERLLQLTDLSQGYRQLTQAGFSLATITQYVKNKLSDDKKFLKAVKSAIYSDFPCRDVPTVYNEPGLSRVLEHVSEDNETLAAIYGLATTPDHRRLIPNPRVTTIINFNLDSLLEAHDTANCCALGAGTKERCFHKIESAATSRIVGRTSVYHPHGYLRFENRENYLGAGSSSSVLSEYEYFDFYNQPTKIFTYTFLHALRETSCLFIGMSMTDDNVRRLLFYSKQELDASRRLRGKEPKDQCRHYPILGKTDPVRERFLTVTLAGLSVKPLWLDSFNENPARLSDLRAERIGPAQHGVPKTKEFEMAVRDFCT